MISYILAATLTWSTPDLSRGTQELYLFHGSRALQHCQAQKKELESVIVLDKSMRYSVSECHKYEPKVGK